MDKRKRDPILQLRRLGIAALALSIIYALMTLVRWVLSIAAK